jgi:hypothetical protein
VGKRGVSYSVGTKGFWYTVNPRTRQSRISIGVPGTGLGWYRVRRRSAPAAVYKTQPLLLPGSSAHVPSLLNWAAMFIIIGVVIFVAGNFLGG